MKLTANFDSSEFDAAGVAWPAGHDVERAELARLAQWLRDLAGVPGIITSAYRTPEHNAEVGGSETSQHMKAEALDVVFPLAPFRTLGARILEAVRAHRAPAFGQIIIYPDRGHVHVSLPRLGDRNGEIRFHVEGAYPFLTSADQLPILSQSQAKAASAGALGLAFVAALALGALFIGGRA